MDEGSPEGIPSTSSQPCTPLTFNPMTPSTSRVPTPARPSSRMSSRQYGSPFRATPQNMEPSNSRVQELREAAIGKRASLNEWMHNGYGGGGGQMDPQQQQQHAMRAGSLMGSNMSVMSNMSEMTAYSYGGLSMLSVNTECGQFDTWMNQSQQALSKVSYSSAENQDPMNMRKTMSIPEIIQALRSTEMMHQVAAIRVLEPIAKNYELESTWNKKDLQPIILALFEVLMPRPAENENVIRKVFEILHHSVLRTSRAIDKIFLNLNTDLMEGRIPSISHHRPTSIYEIVMERAHRIDTNYESSAMILLVHLCCKPYLMRHVYSDTIRSPHFQRLHHLIIDFAIKMLRRPETKPKNRGLSVSIIKNLSLKNRAIKQMAQQMGVVTTFYQIMKDEVIHEDLLWSTMQALTAFCCDSANGEHFVRLGGAQVLCGLLSHGSTRLLHELLGCMKRLADLPAIQEQNMEESIHCIVQLIGSSDVIIVERATGTLRNIALHNKMNKLYMVQNGVTSHALAVLRTSKQYNGSYQFNGNEEIMKNQLLLTYENCLSILNNVTSMSPQDIKESAVQACRMISQNPDAAHILLHYFNISDRKRRKLTVSVMKRVIETVPSFAESFVNLFGTTNDPLPILLLKRAYESLEEWKKSAIEIMGTKFGAETPQRREMEENKRENEDIVRRSVGLLTNLCTQANPWFFGCLKPIINNGSFNPFKWLTYEMTDMILQEWLTFILAICGTEEAIQQKLLLHLLQKANVTEVFFIDLHNRRQAPSIRALIHQLVTAGKQQQMEMNRLMTAQQSA